MDNRMANEIRSIQSTDNNQRTTVLFVFWLSTKDTARIEPALVRGCPWQECSFGEFLYLKGSLTQTNVPFRGSVVYFIVILETVLCLFLLWLTNKGAGVSQVHVYSLGATNKVLRS